VGCYAFRTFMYLDLSPSDSMENFISGYPGCEFQIRTALAEVVGPTKSEFFFDKVSRSLSTVLFLVPMGKRSS
jgi:hypothetical protein